MLKSRVKRLEQKFKQSKEDQILIIHIYPEAVSLIRNSESIINRPDETEDEFRERVRKAGQRIGLVIIGEN